jgi:hypothetical protein
VLVATPKRNVVAIDHATIEPACPDCVHARALSGGQRWWCERHMHGASVEHTFSYEREIPLASHDSEVIPTGIDF